MAEQFLYHFSEDPEIRLFEPRAGRQIEGRPPREQLVWAIDAHHSPVYFFPRECPRIVLWPIEDSTQGDIDRWMNSDSRMVAHIESAWSDRFDNCQLYRYSFNATEFESLHDHGVHVSPAPVKPVDTSPVGNLANALEEANVELRIVGSLQPLADAWHSTLHYSGIRLKNAQDRVVPTGSRLL